MLDLQGDDLTNELYKALEMDYPKFYKMDRQSQFGLLASELLLKDCSVSNYRPESVTTVLMNSHASLDTDIRFHESMLVAPSPSLFVYTLANIVAGEICIRHKIKGESAFLVSDTFNEQLLFDYVEIQFLQPGVEACLAGWIDVLQDQHDVLLYLVEKRRGDQAFEHSSANLRKLYHGKHGKVNV